MSTDMTWQTDTTSSSATEQLAAVLGQNLKGGEVIELVSDLGGGKTTFVRGLARGIGSKNVVSSPTFKLCNVYQVADEPQGVHSEISQGATAKRNEAYRNTMNEHRKAATQRKPETGGRVVSPAGKQAGGVRELWHFDFYRLHEPGIIADELAEVVGEQNAVVVVEWADIVRDVLPENCLTITLTFNFRGEETRHLHFSYPPALGYLMKGLV